ncbi:sodium- and chloride-dependent betaine transporter-like [Clavelina lepadiformis]|uniref:sodium- and chloride-dependent betaine transporter-like n=1 Tax=Clavelina lepadiformis TaxID=159417 RepID=UPI004041B286
MAKTHLKSHELNGDSGELSIQNSKTALLTREEKVTDVENCTDSDLVDGKETKELRQRDTWSGKFDFLLACCGTAVGLGNVWRFPYLCYKNGGGAFLLPYLIVVLVSGLPIFFLEVALGQFTKYGAIKAWGAICPLFSGIGIASMVIVFFTLCYYAVILAWALFYLFQSFRAELPWATCNNSWNDPIKCQDNFTYIRSLNMTPAERAQNFTSPVVEYWENEVLQITEGIHDLGGLRWELAGVLLLAWVICYFTVFKGTKSTGKAMYFTATFPYIMLIILLIRGVTLPGAWKGIEFYIKPNITKLSEPEVWIDAGTQVFFSYSLCIGVLVSLGSFNPYNNNCLRDTMIIAAVNSGTSLLAGFAIFAALGFMAAEQGMEVKDVAEKGPGLAFIAYPKEVLLLPVSQLWSCLFFVMIFLLGISTLLTDTLALVTSFGDLYPKVFRGGKYRKEIAMACGCLLCYLVGLSMVTRGGMYILQLFDFYGASGFTLLWTATWQCVAISWFYGDQKFYDVIKDMIGYRPGPYFRICWKFLAPVMNLAIVVFAIIKYEPLKYNKIYDYPAWGHVLGWSLALASIVCIPLRMFYVLYFSEGNTLKEKFRKSIEPKITIGHGGAYHEKSDQFADADGGSSKLSDPPGYNECIVEGEDFDESTVKVDVESAL